MSEMKIAKVEFLEDFFYNLRERWWKLKWWWKKPNLIKPQYLGNTPTWSDELLVHCMFQVLTNWANSFNKEGHDAWKYTNAEEKSPIEQLLKINEWWHKVYNGKSLSCVELYKDYAPISYTVERDGKIYWEPQYETEEHKRLYEQAIQSDRTYEDVLRKELEDNLIKLVQLREYMY